MKTLAEEIEWIKARMIEDKDFMPLLDMIGKLHNRIELLESQRLEQRSMMFATLLCVRDFAKPEIKNLVSSFDFYTKELHQMTLENLEDFSPSLAARLDKRPDIEPQ